VRPVWVVVARALVGAVLLALIVATVDRFHGYFFVLFAVLLGVSATTFVAFATDRLGYANRIAISAPGVAAALAIFAAIWVIAFLLSGTTLPAGMGLADCVAARRDGMVLGRRGRDLLAVGALVGSTIWLVHGALILVISAHLPPKMQDTFRKI
jgi:prepilin signal peptidase PulO-like enzyme (type II secretory pathway)